MEQGRVKEQVGSSDESLLVMFQPFCLSNYRILRVFSELPILEIRDKGAGVFILDSHMMHRHCAMSYMPCQRRPVHWSKPY